MGVKVARVVVEDARRLLVESAHLLWICLPAAVQKLASAEERRPVRLNVCTAPGRVRRAASPGCARRGRGAAPWRLPE